MRTWPCLSRVSPFQTPSWLNVRPLACAKCHRCYWRAHQGAASPHQPCLDAEEQQTETPPTPSQFSLFQGIITPNNISRKRTSDNHRHIHAGDVLNSHARSQRISSHHTSEIFDSPPPNPCRVPIARPRIQSSAGRASAPCRLTE